jgi:hypothetical protein
MKKRVVRTKFDIYVLINTQPNFHFDKKKSKSKY